MEIKSFSAIRISVLNLEQSSAWYEALFNQEPFYKDQKLVSFNINGTSFDIALADTKSPSSNEGTVGYWIVDNLDQLLAHIEKIGGKVYRGPINVTKIGRKILQVQDPFGNIIGFESPL